MPRTRRRFELDQDRRHHRRLLTLALTLALTVPGLATVVPEAEASPVRPLAVVGLSDGTITAATWTVSNSAAGATGVTYTYAFTTATLSAALTSVTMTVPSGTGGTPAVGTVTGVGNGGTATLSGTTLTYTFVSVLVPAGTKVTIPISGLTNTATGGTYTSTITTYATLLAIDAGTASATIVGVLTAVVPGSLTWAGTLTGSALPLVDTTAGDQQLTITDSRGSGAGWNLTVSATAFTSSSHTLPSGASLVVTGSTASIAAATAPTVTCVGTCMTPSNSTSYPVSVSLGGSAVKIFDTATGSGTGTMTIGGSTATNPLGWWLQVPATSYTGTYTSTVTISMVTGP